ncbi:MAG: hypothetical protein M8350_03455 [Methanosarcinaceae archaeon]|nr:hypothetical protein [Methanosarcinaceae archaeon]
MCVLICESVAMESAACGGSHVGTKTTHPISSLPPPKHIFHICAQYFSNATCLRDTPIQTNWKTIADATLDVYGEVVKFQQKS